MIPNLNIVQTERPWGVFRRFTENVSSTVKIITVKPNESLSLQSHAHRAEFWRIINGSGVVEIAGESHSAIVGDEYIAPVGAKHRISAGPSGIEFLEIAFGDFDEEDIVRFEDMYGRV